MICKECGSEVKLIRLEDDRRACPVCGAEYRRKPSSSSKSNKSNKSKPGAAGKSSRSKAKRRKAKRRVPGVVWMLLGALLGVLVFAVVMLLNPRQAAPLAANGTDQTAQITSEPAAQPTALPQNVPSQAFASVSVPAASGQALRDFQVVDEAMLNLLAGREQHIVFTLRTDEKPDKIELVRVDAGHVLGFMRDDGLDDDLDAGDGVYTFGYDLTAAAYGYMLYQARTESAASDCLRINFFEPVNEDNFAAAQALSATVAQAGDAFKDAGGYVPSESVQSALAAAERCVKSLLESGRVCEYAAGGRAVYCRDSVTGTCMLYAPETEGDMSGAHVIVAQPFASGGAMDEMNSRSPGDAMGDVLDSAGIPRTVYQDEDVYPEIFDRLERSQVLLWMGRGIFQTAWDSIGNGNRVLAADSVLVTGAGNELWYHINHAADFLAGRLGVCADSGRVYVTSRYVDSHCGDLSGSLIWLNACHSAQNSVLAESFLKKNASAVVGYTDSVGQSYCAGICMLSMQKMTEINEATGNYHTLGEALDKAKREFGLNEADFDRRSGRQPDDTPAEAALFGSS
ncbi:MAG: hypothetical protein IJ048_02480, partial [Clostridia bacterium]|nr:hypothetical protein [Clostridia bacterium]